MAKYEMPVQDTRVSVGAIPAATKTTLGGIKVSDDLNIDIDNKLWVNKLSEEEITNLTGPNFRYKFLNGEGLQTFSQNMKTYSDTQLNSAKTYTDTQLKTITDNIVKDVICSHQYEITGNTGDEHGLVIEDQQMLIKRIEGHSGRVSPNLFRLKTGTFGGVTVSYDSKTGVHTFNGTSTGALLVWGQTHPLPQSTKISFIAEVVSGTKTGATNQIGVMIDGVWIATDWVNTKTLSTSIDSSWMSVNVTFNNYKVKINVVEGTYSNTSMPIFQPFNDNFENSRNTLISTGRNILNPDDFGAKCHNYNKATGIATINVPRDADKIFFEKYYFVPNTQYTIILSGKTTETASYHNTTNLKVVYEDNTSAGLVFGKNITTNKTIKNIVREYYDGVETFFNVNECAIIKGVDASFEPYKEEIIDGPTLGKYDYYQEGQLFNYCTDILTFNGNENWTEVDWNTNLKTLVLKDKALATEVWQGVSKDFTILGSSHYTLSNVYESGVPDKTLLVYNDNITVKFTGSLSEFKQHLSSNPIQLVYKKATPTIVDINLPSGYAVYNDGLQEQRGNIPYKITKQYSLSQKAQTLANIEIDREQQALIDNLESEMNSELANKQNNLDSTQLDAVNSGITSTLVSKYDGYANQITELKNTTTSQKVQINELKALNLGWEVVADNMKKYFSGDGTGSTLDTDIQNKMSDMNAIYALTFDASGGSSTDDFITKTQYGTIYLSNQIDNYYGKKVLIGNGSIISRTFGLYVITAIYSNGSLNVLAQDVQKRSSAVHLQTIKKLVLKK